MTEPNLIDYSFTFPGDTFGPEIPLDSKIREITGKFSAFNQCIIVQGPRSSGKTVHLAQFVKSQLNNAFSYFITDNIWNKRPTAFLSSLCTQMEVRLGRAISVDPAGSDLERLRSIFENLTQKIAEIARKEKTPFYFVIDGLDLACQGAPGERIIDLFPLPTSAKGLYFLGSMRSPTPSQIMFPYSAEAPHSFSRVETEKYLEDLNIPSDTVTHVQTVLEGVPGYLAILRKLYKEKRIPLQQILDTASEIESLLEIQWKASGVESNPTWKKIVAIVAFSLSPLEFASIATMLGYDEREVRDCLRVTDLVSSTDSGCVEFHPEILKNIAQRRLAAHKSESLSARIQYYEKQPQSEDSGFLLPEYYRQVGNYTAMVKIVEPDVLALSISESRDLGVAKRRLRQAFEMAKEKQDLAGVLRFGLAHSQVSTLSEQMIGETQVEALIALKQFDKALSVAYSAKLLETRVRLLCRIYLAKEQTGHITPRDAIAEIEQLAYSVGKDCQTDEVLAVAADVFPLSPDVATNLVDHAKGQENKQSTIDLVAALASIHDHNSTGERLAERIQDNSLREFAVANSPWLKKLSMSDLMQKISQTRETKAKIYLLRQWCAENRQNPDSHLALEAALNVINTDPDYRIPLRNLRQLSESLRDCPASHRAGLVKRFEVPSFTGMRSPIEERLRLELNLAEAMADISITDTEDRLQRAVAEIFNMPLDADVSCYCLARILITLTKLGLASTSDLVLKIKAKLEDEFVRLVYMSADQFEVFARTLRALSMVMPKVALEFARMLNSLERRDEGIRTVVAAYVRQDQVTIQPDIIREGLSGITDKWTREESILEIVMEARSTKKLEDASLRSFLLECIQTIEDPIYCCRTLAHIIGALDETADRALIDQLFDRLVDSWEQIDILWQRTEIAFRLVADVANVACSHATILYERACSLRDTTALANQSIGASFYHCLEISTRVIGRLDLSDPKSKETYNQLLKMIDVIPSDLLKVRLASRVAYRRYLCGDKNTFDELMQQFVLPKIRASCPSLMKDRVINEIAVAIFKSSEQETHDTLQSLSYLWRNYAWQLIAIHVMRKTSVGDPVSSESPNVAVNTSQADDVLKILGKMDFDAALAYVTTALARAINHPNSGLIEQQRLDILARAETILEPKLPDPKNITHTGWKLVCQSDIEQARLVSAKRAKDEVTRKAKHAISQMTRDVKLLENVADRVYVLIHLARNLKKQDHDLAIKLIEEAGGLIPQIPNVKDRAERLEEIADGYSDLNNTDRAIEAVKLAYQFASSLPESNREEILKSIVQTAHEIDPDIAAQLTERIDVASDRRPINEALVISDLSKSPQKLSGQLASHRDNADVLADASARMLKASLDGKGVVHPKNVLIDWLATIPHLDFDSSLSVTRWVVESMVNQSTSSAVNTIWLALADALISNARLMFELGNKIAPLAITPESLHASFPGLSANKRLFRVGERDQAINFVKHWLHSNAQETVRLCDPYFDAEQLWILQAIPTDVAVSIITTGHKFGIKAGTAPTREMQKRDKERISTEMSSAWSSISKQSPPPTFVVIHDSVYGAQDEFHDRYIITANAGLSLGTSLNGFGNKEFFITVLATQDAEHVSTTYIEPKLNIQQQFSKVIYFEIE